MRQLMAQGVFFVIRGMENSKLELTERPLRPADEINPHIQFDWEGYSSLPQSKAKYPMKLRIVQVWDEEQQIYLELLTNNFTWTASTISELYEHRWRMNHSSKKSNIHLKIKSFIGTSIKAILIQIWTALITTLLSKTLKKEAKYTWHLLNLVSFCLMESVCEN